MATPSGTVAWKIPWMEEPAGYSLWSHKESDTTERLHFTSYISKYFGRRQVAVNYYYF